MSRLHSLGYWPFRSTHAAVSKESLFRCLGRRMLEADLDGRGFRGQVLPTVGASQFDLLFVADPTTYDYRRTSRRGR